TPRGSAPKRARPRATLTLPRRVLTLLSVDAAEIVGGESAAAVAAVGASVVRTIAAPARRDALFQLHEAEALDRLRLHFGQRQLLRRCAVVLRLHGQTPGNRVEKRHCFHEAALTMRRFSRVSSGAE